MPFATDTPLGPYKIVALIGSGGMGEVYRAHDTRLRRDVALKILPASFTNDPDRLRRFEQEARAVAALNHPNIVSIYDVGEAGGVHYIVSELLEGDSLRERIPAAGLPTRKAIEFAVQFANGLAAAHDRGIVHRDLKPENIFITKTGQVKILDFGLAKLRDAETNDAGDQSSTGISNATVVDAHTSAGQILGTVGYMAPEQVRGDAIDHRADIFSFGSILYEMLCGQRAFKRNTSAETMTAILNEDPQDFATRTNPSGSIAIPPALERIVRHCLEKQPAQRFQSIRDIAFDLESVSSVSATSASVSKIAGTRARNRWVRALAAGLALLALGAVLDAYLRPRIIASSPELHRLTFGRGNIRSARFAGTDVLYSAAWNGRPMDVYLAHPGSTESRLLGMPHSNVLAVSKSGELAILLNQHFVEGFEYVGMLARASQGGGAPRDIADGVEWADWAPDGASLAVVRRVAGQVRLEYPVGKLLYPTAGWISTPRISPDGKLIAFVDHPYSRDDAGSIAIIDLTGKKTTLTINFISVQGLAWGPDGKEVWFTGTVSGTNRGLNAVTLEGKQHVVYLGTGALTLQDISAAGKVIFTRDDWRAGMIGFTPGAPAESELSWHDWTFVRDISDDGKTIAFDETGEAGGETGATYVRGSDGSLAVRLGDGNFPTLSPDGKHILAITPRPQGGRALTESPIGAGDSRTISTGDVHVQEAYYFPDGHHILDVGAIGSEGQRLWVQDNQGGAPRSISPEGAAFRYRGCISPDGKSVAALGPGGKPTIYHVDGSNPSPIPGVLEGDEPVRWMIDGRSLLVGRSEIPMRIFTLDLATGHRKFFKEISPPDLTGLLDSEPPNYSRDLQSYAYSYTRIMSDLYLADGMK